MLLFQFKYSTQNLSCATISTYEETKNFFKWAFYELLPVWLYYTWLYTTVIFTSLRVIGVSDGG